MIRTINELDKDTIEFLIRNGLFKEKDWKVFVSEYTVNTKLTTIEECLKAYMSYLKDTEKMGYSTVQLYMRYAEAFLKYYFKKEFVSEFRDERLGIITLSEVENWFIYLPSIGYTQASLRQYKSGVAKFFEFMNENGYTLPDVRKLKLTNAEESELSAFRDDEIRKIADCAKTSRAKAIMLFIYETAIRRNELVHCKKSHIDFEKRTVTVYKKGKVIRVGYLSKEVADYIKWYIKEWEIEVNELNERRLIKAAQNNTPYNPVEISEYLFQTYITESVSYATIQRDIVETVERYCETYKIDTEKAKFLMESVSTETLRHSRRVFYLSEGHTIEQVKSLIGDEITTRTHRFLPLAQKLYPEKFQN